MGGRGPSYMEFFKCIIARHFWLFELPIIYMLFTAATNLKLTEALAERNSLINRPISNFESEMAKVSELLS